MHILGDALPHTPLLPGRHVATQVPRLRSKRCLRTRPLAILSKFPVIDTLLLWVGTLEAKSSIP